MEKTIIRIFTSPTCPYCPGAVKTANEIKSEMDDVEVKEISTATEEGHRLAKQFQIMTVPTIFVQNSGKEEIIAFRGSISKKRLQEAVQASQGRKSMS